jgi:hypothetical protein
MHVYHGGIYTTMVCIPQWYVGDLGAVICHHSGIYTTVVYTTVVYTTSGIYTTVVYIPLW